MAQGRAALMRVTSPQSVVRAPIAQSALHAFQYA